MDYGRALTNINRHNRLHSKSNELLKSVIAILDYLTEDAENESKDDMIEWIESVKFDLSNAMAHDKKII